MNAEQYFINLLDGYRQGIDDEAYFKMVEKISLLKYSPDYPILSYGSGSCGCNSSKQKGDGLGK